MAGRRKDVLDIREIVRRLRLGETERQIARDLAIARKTVKKYRDWAKAQGYLDEAELPELGVIEARFISSFPLPVQGPPSTAERFRQFIVQKRAENVEIKALLGLLKEHGYEGSYTSLRRFVNRLEPKEPEAFTRVETAPSEEAQVDFGYVGEIYDEQQKQMRRAWIFVMTLSWSRHLYVEIVFDQKVETWCACHIRAFEFFGGTVKRVVLDNLKAGIVKAVLYDPEPQRAYRELAEHYGFSISPCRPRTPRHKGKVEQGGVHYVKRNALAGRTFTNHEAGNAHLMRWVMQVAGVRDHGTTHEAPLKRFERERPVLKPLPATRYEPTAWKQVKLHPDCHVVFESNFYSAPYRLVGRTLLLRALPQRVEIYLDHALITTHPRSVGRGVRVTNDDHLPPEKIRGLLTTWDYLRRQAAEIGPKTAEVIETLSAERPMDRMRTGQGILGFAKRFGSTRLEAACSRALQYGDLRYSTIKGILKSGKDKEPLLDPSTQAAPLPKTAAFARPVSEQTPQKLF